MGYIQRELDVLSEEDYERLAPFKHGLKMLQHQSSILSKRGDIEAKKTRDLVLKAVDSLLYRNPLSEITDAEQDWHPIRFHGGTTDRFQHKRDGSLFKHADGKTYYRAIKYTFNGRHIAASVLKDAHEWIEVTLPRELHQFTVELEGTEGNFEVHKFDLLEVAEYYNNESVDLINDKPLVMSTIAGHGKIEVIGE